MAKEEKGAMKKILWATDGSAEAEIAYKYAKYLAVNSGADIIGVHVIPRPVQLLYENLNDTEHLNNWRLSIEDSAASSFDNAAKDLSKVGVSFEGLLLKGKPSEKIRELAKKSKADLIVMGKHGHGFFETMVAGSETIKVLKGSHIPVLAIKSEKKKKAEFKNILVPIDLTECSDSAVSYALRMAQVTGAKLRVVYVLRLDMYAQDIPASALEIVIKQSEKTLSQRVAKIKKTYERKKSASKNIKINYEVIHGMTEAAAISRYAEKNNTDLIVIHTHGRAGIKRFLLGSVTDRVISSSKCSVLALRPEE